MATSTPFLRPKLDLLCPESDQQIKSLADLLSFNAVNNPSHTFIVQGARSPEKPPLTFTFASFQAAVRGCEEWLKEKLTLVKSLDQSDSVEGYDVPPVALLLQSDAGLLIYLCALLSLDVPSLLLSIRLSPDGIRHLIQKTGAKVLLSSPRTERLAEDVSRSCSSDIDIDKCHNFSVHKVAPFEDFLEAALNGYINDGQGPRSSGHMERLRKDADRRIIILHSSGTTGLPKPIYLTHRYLLGYAACHEFPEDKDMSGISVSTLPLYHGFGLLAPSLALSVGMPCCLPASSVIPTGQSTVDLIRQAKATSMMTVPSILEDLVAEDHNSDDYLKNMKTLASLDFVAVGGGAMKLAMAQELDSHGVTLLNHYGATEIGALAPIFYPDASYDWRYLKIRKDIGLELHFTEAITGEEEPRMCRLIGYPFGWNTSFELQDELECHPKRQEMVRIIGRNDDLIVLGTGEKVLPRILEDILSQSPLVKTAVAFGTGRFMLGVLVEPSNYDTVEQDQDAFIQLIWPFIEKANSITDSHAHITSKRSVIVKPRHKTIPRSDKGSVMRKEFTKIFEDDINETYKNLEEDNTDPETNFKIDLNDLERSLAEIAQSCLPKRVTPDSWNFDDDIFELGLDSLQAGRFHKALSAAVADQGGDLRVGLRHNFLYVNPSVAKMATALRNPKQIQQSKGRGDEMRKLTKRFSPSWMEIDFDNAPPPIVALVTGSTGNLGSYVLESLSRHPQVQRIICLGRSTKGEQGGTIPDRLRKCQEDINQERGIFLTEEEWGKIEFLPWEPGSQRLGLTQAQFDEVCSSVTHIFHAAWPMNFNRALPSFDSHVQAVSSFIKLSLRINKLRPLLKPKFVFLSSIAAVGQYISRTNNAVVPEEFIADPLVSLPMGYAEAKWVCESIIDEAAREFGDRFSPCVVRVGQISGSRRNGLWNQKEHIPALIKAAREVGSFPYLAGNISWLPVDEAASILTEILTNPTPLQKGIFLHLENPVRQSWSDISTILARKLQLKDSDGLPFKDWLMAASANNSLPPELAEFFGDHFVRMATDLVLNTSRARSVSAQLRAVSSVSMSVVESYVEI